jgi:NDP-sugar pyrophosphorylase family protein
MQAVILAGGMGTRLLPLTEEIPKPLVPIGGTPIIELLLKRLKRCGVEKAHLAVGHRAGQIRELLGKGDSNGLEIAYSEESVPLSTVAPIKRIADLPEDFLVTNGDVLTDLDFGDLYEAHSQNDARITVATCRRTNCVDYGVFEVDSQGLATDFTEKPSQSLLVSMGVYVFSRTVLELIPDGRAFGFDDLIYLMLSRGEPIATYPFDGYWLDIGRLEDYRQAQQDVVSIKGLLD